MKCMEETTEQVLLFANNLMRVAEKNEEVKGNLSMLDETMVNRFLRGVERLTKLDIGSNVDIRQIEAGSSHGGSENEAESMEGERR